MASIKERERERERERDRESLLRHYGQIRRSTQSHGEGENERETDRLTETDRELLKYSQDRSISYRGANKHQGKSPISQRRRQCYKIILSNANCYAIKRYHGKEQWQQQATMYRTQGMKNLQTTR